MQSSVLLPCTLVAMCSGCVLDLDVLRGVDASTEDGASADSGVDASTEVHPSADSGRWIQITYPNNGSSLSWGEMRLEWASAGIGGDVEAAFSRDGVTWQEPVVLANDGEEPGPWYFASSDFAGTIRIRAVEATDVEARVTGVTVSSD